MNERMNEWMNTPVHGPQCYSSRLQFYSVRIQVIKVLCFRGACRGGAKKSEWMHEWLNEWNWKIINFAWMKKKWLDGYGWIITKNEWKIEWIKSDWINQ